VAFVIRDPIKRAAARIVDAAIGSLVRPGPAPTVPAAPRVLVIRCDHIGDAVMATSVLAPLRDALQPTKLDVLVGPWARAVFDNHPLVDEVLTVAAPWWSAARGASFVERVRAWSMLPATMQEIKGRRYDIGIELRGDLRQIVFFLHATRIPIRVSSDRTGGVKLLTHVWHHDERLHEVEKDFAIAALIGARGEPHLAVHSQRRGAPRFAPRSYAVLALRGSSENRQWPAEHAAAVVDAFHDAFGLASVTIGGATDVTLANAVARLARSPVQQLAGTTSLADSIEVIRNARIVIAVDSGPMHLAAAAGVPVVALFGPGDPAASGPWTDCAQVVAANAPCGCRRAPCDFTRDAGRCMRLVTPALVLDAVRRALT